MPIYGSLCRRIKHWVTAAIATHKTIVSAHHTDHKVAQAESAQFKDVNIPVGEAYKQATKIILRINDLNTFVGADTGKNTTGNENSFMGYRAGYSNTTGYRNNFMGYGAGYSNITGYQNNFMGAQAGYTNTGYQNNFMGAYAGCYNTTGYQNNFMGAYAGYSNTTGYQNNFMGYAAGYLNSTGYQNILVGYKAGFYETGNNKLLIDNQQRTNEADGRIKALIYGIFNAATANQLLRLNGVLELTVVSEYADNAAAIAGGLAVNTVYRTGDAIKIVH